MSAGYLAQVAMFATAMSLTGAAFAQTSTTATASSTATTTATTATAPASGESATKLSDVTPQNTDVKKEGDVDTDEVITNRKLRAETGAKKKYSFSSAVTYSGGTINNPMSDVRPNITAGIGTQIAPRLSGSVGMKYRLSPLQTLSASVGVGVDKPFHSDDKKSFRERSSASNPGVSYTTMYKALGIQNVSSVSASAYTTDFLRTNGYIAGFGFTQTMVYDFGGSKTSVGLSASLSTSIFDKDDARLAANQGDYGVGAFPFFEYVINDKLNFRTLIGFMADHSRATGDFWTWTANKVYQSAGLGISVTRDLYLYPNVQFIPEDIRADRTNVGITANINL
ncbi:MAG: hypothetical protein J0L82_14950 [Deltaproteobacteria bacterium]|nr:hypothetical protein [Deltaproteobacteria bacterium]